MSLKTVSNELSVYNIVLTTETPLLNHKGCEVNSHLKTLRGEKSVSDQQHKHF